jgi:hypothetical protein
MILFTEYTTLKEMHTYFWLTLYYLIQNWLNIKDITFNLNLKVLTKHAEEVYKLKKLSAITKI